MSKALLKVGIAEGLLTVTDAEVIIDRHNKAQRRGLAAQTRIPIQVIVGTRHQPSGFVANGSMEFIVSSQGGATVPSVELVVSFTGRQQSEVIKAWQVVEKMREKLANPPLLFVKGVNGQVELFRDKVRIRRQGGMAVLGHGLKGDKEIMLDSLSSIQFRPPGGLTNGYIQFAFSGGSEAKGALFQATQDENSVMFTSAQLPAFQQLKDAIDQQRARNALGSVAAPSSGLDDLEKLAGLRDRGIITNDEFEAKKKQILGI